MNMFCGCFVRKLFLKWLSRGEGAPHTAACNCHGGGGRESPVEGTLVADNTGGPAGMQKPAGKADKKADFGWRIDAEWRMAPKSRRAGDSL